MLNQCIELSTEECERYSRQIQLCEIGLVGQKKLKSSSAIVIGAGGLGCAVIQYLAAAGIGRISIVDDDRVDLSNMQRQILYHTDDLGKLKCDVAHFRALQINPHVKVHAHAVRLASSNAKNLIEQHDVIIDCTDNFVSRYLINDACIEAQRPFIYGSIHQFEGQASIFNALMKGFRGPGYRSLFPFPPDPAAMPTCSQGGVLSPLPGVIGSIQALETIKLLLNMGDTLSGKLLKIDALTWKIKLYNLACPEQKSGQLEITIEELNDWIENKIHCVLVDIREAFERAPDSPGINIPFSKLMKAPHILPKGQLIVLYCQTGRRSAQAAKWLRAYFQSDQIFSLVSPIQFETAKPLP